MDDESGFSTCDLPEGSSLPPDSQINAEKAIQYWNDVPSSLSGIMGGFPQINRIDIRTSAKFLTSLQFRRNPVDPPIRGADCGAGIGRVTKDLLTFFCSTVDIVEPVRKFTDEITTGDTFVSLRIAGKIGNVYNVGLEHWTPREQNYDLIWNQWCVGHLRDTDLIAYLRRCAIGITFPNGVIVVKENLSSGEEDIYDDQDSSVTRTESKFKKIFKDAGLVIVKQEVQRGFPPHLGLFKQHKAGGIFQAEKGKPSSRSGIGAYVQFCWCLMVTSITITLQNRKPFFIVTDDFD